MQYEVEIKSLLGNEENASMLRSRMQARDPNFRLVSTNKQLNHYFVAGDLEKLTQEIAPHLKSEALAKLKNIANHAKEFSIRTRDKDGSVFLVVKASVGEDSSANGVARLEFEEKVNVPLDELDNVLRQAGFEYQAKWSRDREEFVCRGINVCLDRNAGYGYLAEFEKVVHSEDRVDAARQEVRAFMDSCGVQELQQDRLERMFSFYNAHWPEYYGTDKIFTIA